MHCSSFVRLPIFVATDRHLDAARMPVLRPPNARAHDRNYSGGDHQESDDGPGSRSPLNGRAIDEAKNGLNLHGTQPLEKPKPTQQYGDHAEKHGQLFHRDLQGFRVVIEPGQPQAATCSWKNAPSDRVGGPHFEAEARFGHRGLGASANRRGGQQTCR